MPSNAAILRRVALATLEDSRKAWRKARTSPTVPNARAAYRACVLASRALRRAARALPSESRQMTAKADELDKAKTSLIEMIELAELDAALAALEE